MEGTAMKVITLHSNRGGVGKTLVALNLALAYANQRHHVALVDLDFRAPRLSTMLQELAPSHWMNDLFDGSHPTSDPFIDASPRFTTPGTLRVGLINPALEAIRNLAMKDRRWHRRALQILTALRDRLAAQGVDFLIFDTSPGLLFSSVNAVASADLILIITTADQYDLQETEQLCTELYHAFEKPTYILMNKVHPSFQWDDDKRTQLQRQVRDHLPAPIIRIMPCFCDLLHTSRIDYAVRQPDHPFSQEIYRLADAIAQL
jgi:septum site-determining protein MinD